jgi:hypothetical protein
MAETAVNKPDATMVLIPRELLNHPCSYSNAFKPAFRKINPLRRERIIAPLSIFLVNL